MTLLLYTLAMIVGGSVSGAGAVQPHAPAARSMSASRHDVMLAGNAVAVPRWAGTKPPSGLFVARSSHWLASDGVAPTSRAGWRPAVHVVDDVGTIRTIAIGCSL